MIICPPNYSPIKWPEMRRLGIIKKLFISQFVHPNECTVQPRWRFHGNIKRIVPGTDQSGTQDTASQCRSALWHVGDPMASSDSISSSGAAGAVLYSLNYLFHYSCGMPLGNVEHPLLLSMCHSAYVFAICSSKTNTNWEPGSVHSVQGENNGWCVGAGDFLSKRRLNDVNVRLFFCIAECFHVEYLLCCSLVEEFLEKVPPENYSQP